MYKREEQNFVLSNEIDNMSLIMPSQTKPTVVQMDPTLESKKPTGKIGTFGLPKSFKKFESCSGKTGLYAFVTKLSSFLKLFV